MTVVAARRELAGILLILLLVWCGWASGFRAGTRAGQWAWLVSLAAVLAVALGIYVGRSKQGSRWHIDPASVPWPRPGGGGTRRALAGTAPWLALAVAILAWEIGGIDTGVHEPHLTLSALSLALRPVRAGALAVWMGVAVCFAVARTRASVHQQRQRRRGRPEDPSQATSASALALGGGPDRHVVGLLALLEGRNRAVGVAFWLGVLAYTAGADFVARRSSGRIATFEELLGFISRPLSARVFLVVAWTYAGWHLFAH
jgi:hypothetical protein